MERLETCVDILIKVSFVYIGKKIIKIVATDAEQGIYIKRSDYYGIQAQNYYVQASQSCN
jgi:hypothetical protein